ncbi:DUF3617 domain-containing protein [Sphingobium vermicomposti]|uniref:DUF3617 domain-containing protein n=1 Tax=Sphingobium vermicomposti TaxID=529005 RepID=A0A846M0J6_9SPHN|nr:DUF3617 domain-containing protein [Sphingobium vermicomposti]NIJ15677.1 hypothetical protein [Sphingobium vermicomposti]
MRKTVLAMAGATALLAGCGDKPTGTPMSKDEVKAEVEKVQLKPGQWESSFTLEDIDMPNMPGGGAQMEEQMKKMMTRSAIRYCVTPEEATNPGGKMFSGQENKDCVYKGFNVGGGSVKGEISCKSQGGAMTAVMSGKYAPESYEMHMDMKTSGAANGADMHMKAKTTGKWVAADCAAT